MHVLSVLFCLLKIRSGLTDLNFYQNLIFVYTIPNINIQVILENQKSKLFIVIKYWKTLLTEFHPMSV